MDGMNIKRPPRPTTDGIRSKPRPVTPERAAPPDRVIQKRESPIEKDNYGELFVKKIKPQQRKGSVFVRRIIVASIWCIGVFVFVGFLYSRATITITALPRLYTTQKTITITTKPQIGAVSAIWGQSVGSGQTHPLYPEYVPLARFEGSGETLLVSRNDIAKSISNEVYEQYPLSAYKMGNIWITAAEFDTYVAVSKPESFRAKISISALLVPVIDEELVKSTCAYVPVDGSLEHCLSSQINIEKAQAVVYPWFAYRLPIARAITVKINN